MFSTEIALSEIVLDIELREIVVEGIKRMSPPIHLHFPDIVGVVRSQVAVLLQHLLNLAQALRGKRTVLNN